MKFHRIYSIILRNGFEFKHSFDRVTDAFWWPAMDLILWGLTGSYFAQFAPDSTRILLAILSGILLWIVVYRAQYEINVGFLEDIWARNLINIFASPLTFGEWITSFLIIGIIKVLVTFSFATVLAFILYKINVFTFGFYLLPFGVLLFMTGVWVSFIVSGLILRYGQRLQALSWTLLVIISPFSAIYYPLSVLPTYAQKIALLIPTSYIFEGMREVIYKGTLNMNTIIISFMLNILYIGLSFLFLKSSFKKIFQKGLLKIY